MITPTNKNILVQAHEEKSPFQSHEKQYAEKGTIIAMAEDASMPIHIRDIFHVGDIVSFASHFAYRVEDEGNEYWFIPYDKINGKYEKDK